MASFEAELLESQLATKYQDVADFSLRIDQMMVTKVTGGKIATAKFY